MVYILEFLSVLAVILLKSEAQLAELCVECESLAKISLNTSVIKFGQIMCENFCDMDGQVVGLHARNSDEELVCNRCRKAQSHFMCSLCNPAEKAKIVEAVLQEEEDEDDDDLPPAARKSSFFSHSFNDTKCDKCIDRGRSPFCFQCSLKDECRTCNNTIECKSCNLFRKHTVHVSMLWEESEKPVNATTFQNISAQN